MQILLCWSCGNKADFVCLRAASLYLQPKGRSPDSLSGGSSQRSNVALWTGIRKGWWFQMAVLCAGSYPIAANSPDNLLKSHLITVNLYRSCSIWSFCHCLLNLYTSDSLLTANICQRKAARWHVANYTLCYTCYVLWEEEMSMRPNEEGPGWDCFCKPVSVCVCLCVYLC